MNASVVVPLYNNELYIERCITSILNQTYKDFELIIIDDGSTDNSLQICKKYESEKVHIFTKKNGGPSSARNFGISKCSQQSKYLFFIDSDDAVAPNYLSDMMGHTEEDCMVICDIQSVNATTYSHIITDINIESNSTFLQQETITNFWKSKRFMELLKNGVINSSCNKRYSLNIIRTHNLQFANTYPEDFTFNFEYLGHCNSIHHINSQLYYYIHTSNSVTSKAYKSLYDNYMRIQEQLYKKVPASLHSFIEEFVYPQYLGNTKNYLRAGDFDTPEKYRKKPLIKRAISKHKPTCFGDRVVKYLFKYGLYGILIKL